MTDITTTRRSPPKRCAFCHGDDGEIMPCSKCGAAHHDECRKGGCVVCGHEGRKLDPDAATDELATIILDYNRRLDAFSEELERATIRRRDGFDERTDDE